MRVSQILVESKLRMRGNPRKGKMRVKFVIVISDRALFFSLLDLIMLIARFNCIQ